MCEMTTGFLRRVFIAAAAVFLAVVTISCSMPELSGEAVDFRISFDENGGGLEPEPMLMYDQVHITVYKASDVQVDHSGELATAVVTGEPAETLRGSAQAIVAPGSSGSSAFLFPVSSETYRAVVQLYFEGQPIDVGAVSDPFTVSRQQTTVELVIGPLAFGGESVNGDVITYSIGDVGPAGGWIFYVDDDDEYDWTYLEVTPFEARINDTGTSNPRFEVGPDAQGTAIGTGLRNTAAMNAAYGVHGQGVSRANRLEHDGFDDWFLPSRDELEAVYLNLVVPENDFAWSGNWWFTSSETDFDPERAYTVRFGTGGVSHSAKNSLTGVVRAVRAFGPNFETFEVTFDTQGGAWSYPAYNDRNVASQRIAANSTAFEPSNVSRDGHVLLGWFDAATDGNEWNFDTAVTGDITLYAQWEDDEPSNGDAGSYEIGDNGPAGGIVFYDHVDETGEIHPDGWRYLEAAPSDSDDQLLWLQGDDWLIGDSVATQESIGAGQENTIIMLTNPEDIRAPAAEYTDELVVENNGMIFDDWFLPSKAELNLMHLNLHSDGLGNFAEGVYWSSSESAIQRAWSQDFVSGNQGESAKFVPNRVRAARAF